MTAYELFQRLRHLSFLFENKKERSLLEQPNNKEGCNGGKMEMHARIGRAQRDTGSVRGQIDAMAALNHLNKLKQVKELKRT